jgi:hypothetical protein
MVAPQNRAGLALRRTEMQNANALVASRIVKFGQDDERTQAAKVVASEVAGQWFSFFMEA